MATKSQSRSLSAEKKKKTKKSVDIIGPHDLKQLENKLSNIFTQKLGLAVENIGAMLQKQEVKIQKLRSGYKDIKKYLKHKRSTDQGLVTHSQEYIIHEQAFDRPTLHMAS